MPENLRGDFLTHTVCCGHITATNVEDTGRQTMDKQQTEVGDQLSSTGKEPCAPMPPNISKQAYNTFVRCYL